MQLFCNLFGTRLYNTINKSNDLADLINVLPTLTNRALAAAFNVLGRNVCTKT